jgi:hypothetical protein
MSRRRNPWRLFQIASWKRPIGFIVFGISLVHANLHGQAGSPLTLDQIQSLLHLGAPDLTIAHEIEARGVAFQMSSPLLNQLEHQSAGKETLAALRKLISPAADEVASMHDAESEAWGAKAAASFSSGEWEQFAVDSRKALLSKQPISIRMMEEHNHRGWSGESIEPVELTITPTNLAVRWLRSGYSSKAISAPLSTIGTIEVTDKSTVGKGVLFIVRHLTPGTYLLHVDIQNGKRADDRMQLYLTTTDSQIVKAQGGVNYLSSPATSLKALEAVARVIGMGAAGAKSQH